MPSLEIQTSKVSPMLRPHMLIQEKEAELERGKQAVEAMEQIPEFSKWKVSRVKSRVRFLEAVIGFLKEGFIPIPRMEYDELHEYTASIHFEKLPVEALATVAEYRDKFNAIGIVRPRSKKRDPIIVGIVRNGQNEEHFILAWWRPDIMREGELW